MAAQVEVAAVVNALDLLPAEGKLVLDVERRPGVVGQLVGAVLVPLQLRGREPEALVPLHAPLAPALEPLGVGAGLHEELHLHLLELAGPEDEVPGRDLVPERLADLGDPERNALPRALQHVEVVDVDALRRLRPQVDHRRLFLDRPHERLEHEVEHPRLGERPPGAADGALRVGLAGRALDARVVGAEAVLAVPAVDQRIGEAGDVAGRLPDLRMHQDRGIEALDVVPRVDHGVPPAVLHVLLELDAQRTVVPHRAEAAVDLGGLEDEAAALAEGDQLVHQGGVGHGVHRCRGGVATGGRKIGREGAVRKRRTGSCSEVTRKTVL